LGHPLWIIRTPPAYAKGRSAPNVPDESRRATLDAMDDIAIIAQIMRALGNGPDDIEGAVVHWLGKRLCAPYEVLEHID
jgi:hypothetical protein